MLRERLWRILLSITPLTKVDAIYAFVNSSQFVAKFKEDLMHIARTTLSSKVLGHGSSITFFSTPLLFFRIIIFRIQRKIRENGCGCCPETER